MCGGRNTERRCCRLYAKLKQKQPYREKVTTSLAVYGIFAVIGGIKGQIGPAFIDLQSICDVGLEEGAWIVTSLYIGYTLGALANGFLYNRCNGNLLFSVSAVCLTVIVAAIPWCTHYSLMVLGHTGMGLVVGLIDAAGNAEIIRLWKTKSKTVLVGLHVIFNLGGVISPLIIAPFLMGNADQSEDITTDLPDQIAISTIDRMNNSLRHSTNFHQRTSANNTSENYESENVSRIYIAYSISSVFCVLHTLWFIFLYFTKKGNKRSNDDSQMTMEHSNDPTQMTIEHSNYPTQMTKEHSNDPTQMTIENSNDPTQMTIEHSNDPTQMTMEHSNDPTQMTIEHSNDPTQMTKEHSNDPTQMTIEHSNDPTHLNEKVNGHSSGQGYTNNQEHSNVLEPSNGTVNGYSKVGAARPSQKVKDTSGGHIPRELQFLGLVFMVIMAAISNAIDFSFSTYLSSFCVEFLHWSKASGSMITSLLFIMVVLGGTLSMFLTKCINSVIYIGLQMILILVSLILLLLSINFHLTVGVWLSAPLLGFAKSAIFPLIISWTNKTFIRVSGRISSAFFVGAMGGSSINLFMLASVMESTGKIWFCYVLIVESILLILFFITTVILSQYVKHWKRKQAAKANENESTYTFTDG